MLRWLAMMTFIWATPGCAVLIAENGWSAPRTSFARGSTRNEVERELGWAVSSKRIDDLHGGGQMVVYHYRTKPANASKKWSWSLAHALLDVVTLGLWELVGTPIELFRGFTTHEVLVNYDPDGRVR